MLKNDFYNIDQQLKETNRVLLTCHQNPDFDSVGSMLAFYIYLKKLNKKVGFFMADPAPESLDFLPFYDELKSEELGEKKWDVVISLDAGSLDRIGLEKNQVQNSVVINFDHHSTNENFGQINVVLDYASATCEIVYDFFEEIGAEIDRPMATCLLAGILDDTGGFSNSATNFKAIKTASQLVKLGAKINQIANHIFKNKSIDALRLWGLILSRLTMDKKVDCVYTYITEKDLWKYKATENDLDSFANFLNVLSDVSFAMFVRASQSKLRVSFRTSRDGVDVAELAGLFGGGGHVKAAGFTLENVSENMEKEIEKILFAIAKKLKKE